jgi:alpha-L-fucosidase
MNRLILDGFGGKVKYAQFLNDASEAKFIQEHKSSVMNEGISGYTLILGLPIKKPDVVVPVIELFLI